MEAKLHSTRHTTSATPESSSRTGTRAVETKRQQSSVHHTMSKRPTSAHSQVAQKIENENHEDSFRRVEAIAQAEATPMRYRTGCRRLGYWRNRGHKQTAPLQTARLTSPIRWYRANSSLALRHRSCWRNTLRMADSAADAGHVVDMTDPAVPRLQPPDNLPALRAARAAFKQDLKKATKEIKLEAGAEASLPKKGMWSYLLTRMFDTLLWPDGCPVKRRRLMKKAAGLSAADLAWLLAVKAACERPGWARLAWCVFGSFLFCLWWFAVVP